MSDTVSGPADSRFAHLAHCFFCRCPIEETQRSDEPRLCGPCYHRIFNAAGRVAVRQAYTDVKAREGAAVTKDDLGLIEVVLYGLWAPHDGDPQAPAEVLNDVGTPLLTVNDVIRARRAFARLSMKGAA